jgi:hypothetical protein
VGEVYAPGGLASLSFEGAAIPFTDLQAGYYSFNEAVGFASDAATLSMSLVAQYNQAQSSELQIDFYRDQTEPLSLLLSVRDQDDNTTEQEYILRLDAMVDVTLLLPSAGTKLVHGNTPIALQVAVEVSGSCTAESLAEPCPSISPGTAKRVSVTGSTAPCRVTHRPSWRR